MPEKKFLCADDVENWEKINSIRQNYSIVCIGNSNSFLMLRFQI